MSKVRTIVLMLLAVSIIVTVLWTRDSREIRSISKNFTESNIANTYTVEECTYGIFLSDTESVYYQYKINSENIFINVIDDRSYSYQDLGTEIITNDNNDEPSYQFLYQMNSKVLSQVNENELYPINFEWNDDADVLHIVEYVHSYLGHESKLTLLSDLYEVIRELFDIGVNHGNSSIIGNADTVGFSLTVSTDILVENITEFYSHLKIIYGVEKAELIIESIEDSNYSNVHISLKWDEEKSTIIPYLSISFKNITYYEIAVFPSDFYSYESFQ